MLSVSSVSLISAPQPDIQYLVPNLFVCLGHNCFSHVSWLLTSPVTTVREMISIIGILEEGILICYSEKTDNYLSEFLFGLTADRKCRGAAHYYLHCLWLSVSNSNSSLSLSQRPFLFKGQLASKEIRQNISVSNRHGWESNYYNVWRAAMCKTCQWWHEQPSLSSINETETYMCRDVKMCCFLLFLCRVPSFQCPSS